MKTNNVKKASANNSVSNNANNSLQERVKTRIAELKAKGVEYSYIQILQEESKKSEVFTKKSGGRSKGSDLFKPEIFNGILDPEKLKKLRKSMRKELFSKFSDIIRYHENKRENLLKTAVIEFSDWYKLVYACNDYTVQSVFQPRDTENVTTQCNLKLCEKALTIIKSNL